MKVAAFLLLLSGWFLVLSALVLLRAWPRAVFVLAAIGVEALGLGLAFRAHVVPHERRR